MKKSFFLLLFACLASVLVGQNTSTTENLVIRDDIEGLYNGGNLTEVTSRTFTIPDVNTDGYILASERGWPLTVSGLRSGAYTDLVWRPVSEYTIFDSGLNLEVFEREVQIRYRIYEIAAEAAIAGDAETEGVAWFIVDQMKEPDFEAWYNSTLPAMLEMLSIPESTSKEDVATAKKVQRLKKRLFPARE